MVSQVHAFQETLYPYSPDRVLQSYLRRRIALLSVADIQHLATAIDGGVQGSSERQTRRVQDTLKKVKATFQ